MSFEFGSSEFDWASIEQMLFAHTTPGPLLQASLRHAVGCGAPQANDAHGLERDLIGHTILAA
jgi:hypothetical protein